MSASTTQETPAVLAFPTPDAAEARRATHDGYIWPVSRRDMRSAQHIRARMAEDLALLLRQRGQGAVIVTDDYLRKGWTRQQVTAHALAAGRLLAKPAAAGALTPTHEAMPPACA